MKRLGIHEENVVFKYLKGPLIDKMFRKDPRYGYIFSERSNSTVWIERREMDRICEF